MTSDDIVDIGEEHHKAGRLQEAESCYQKALELDPGHPGALYLLANIAYDDGRLQFATQLVEELLRDEPSDAEAWHLLGAIAANENNFPRAIECQKKAVALQPAFELAYLNLGQVLRSQKRLDEAIAIYRQASMNLPNAATIHLSLGIVLLENKQYADAIPSVERAILLDPNCAEAHGNLGILLSKVGRRNEAVIALKRVVELIPQNPRSRIYLAAILKQQGRLTEAIECWREAVALEPDYVEPHQCLLNFVQYLPDYSREKILADHVAFGERFEAAFRDKWPKHSKPVDRKKRLHIGFVSGDMYGHSVGFFFAGVLRELRQLDGVNISIYAMNTTEDWMTDRLRAQAHAWLSVVDLSDDALERRIRDDNIDILVDLSGHNADNRLMVFARKPAPIQVTWLGYWETTGLQAIDYILCDRHSVCDDEAVFFVEKPWYLPDTRLCFTLPDESIAVAALPALSNGYVTFGCFNNLMKMTDRVVAVWSRILKRVPNARLWLKCSSLFEANIREEVQARFAAEGISSDRLELEAGTSLQKYFLAYNGIDIALDPFPFTGGTTSVQGIWMGVPMITLRGDRIISRQGVSILSNLGLQDWIAENEDGYVEMAVRRANDLAGLADLRNQLREKLEMSSLCDAKLFARNLETAFTGMWEKYCDASS